MIQTDNRTAGTRPSPIPQCLLCPRRIHDNPCTHSDMCSAGSGHSCLATETASKLRHENVPHQAMLPAHLQCRRGTSPGGRATQMERSPSAALSKAYAQPSKIPRLSQADSSAAPQQQSSKGTAAFSKRTILHGHLPSWLSSSSCSAILSYFTLWSMWGLVTFSMSVSRLKAHTCSTCITTIHHHL